MISARKAIKNYVGQLNLSRTPFQSGERETCACSTTKGFRTGELKHPLLTPRIPG